MAAGSAPSQRGGAVFSAAISAGLLNPFGNLWSAISACSPSSRRGLTAEQRPPSWALSSVWPVDSRSTYYREGDGRRPNRMVAEEYEHNGGPPQQKQPERLPFPRSPVIQWQKDLGNVQLMGRDIEIKYLDSGKVVATTSLAGHKRSQRTEDPSWFTLKICDDLAEIAVHHLAKRKVILVAGKIVEDKRVKDDARSTISSQSQAEVARMGSSQLNWNHPLSSQSSQGAKVHDNNVAQLETQSPQTRPGASKWREAATMIELNRNPLDKVVGGMESRQQNTELKRVGDIKGNLTRNRRATDVLEIRELEPLSREEEGQSSPISDGQVTETPVRQDLRTGEVLWKAIQMDRRSSSASMKAGLNLITRGRLQSSACYSTRDWSRDTAERTGSSQMHSAGTTTETIAGLQSRLQRALTTEHTCIQVLQICSIQRDLLATTQVHDLIIQSGMDKNLNVAVTLLNVYIKCGALLDARRVFYQLEKKSVITWNAMIAGYGKNGNAESAFQLFKLMRQEGARPNDVTYLCILKACASPSALKWGKEVHACIRHGGFESDIRVGSALLQMYAKCGCITDAKLVFENLTRRNIITWNIMVGALAESGRGMEAYGLFLQMRREGFEPDAFTYASILNAASSAGALEWVKKVHGHALKAGLESDLRVGSALVHMYAKSGSIDDAQQVFDRMGKRSAITWNIIIGALAEIGRGTEAYGLFLQMRRDGFEPDAFTYASILNASASTGALEWVKKVHGHALKAGLESDLRVGSALVHIYAKSGRIDEAQQVFDRMQKRDVITWNIMIGGLAQHGHGHEALDVFRKLNADHVKPNEASFVAALSACSHGGLVDEGRKLFSSMTQDYGIEPDILHYNCMVDMLGRAGHLDEAKQFILEMPIEPDDVTWTSLLGACRTYGNVELGELAANELFKLDPGNASTYVLLSNIYAAAGKWEKVSSVRTMMQERRIRKEPGRSWIEVDNKIHEFVVGDTSHPEAEAIYTELNKLSGKLKAEGYIPDTRLVLHDTKEEDKELALCSHSEKLAIVYGLMHLPLGEPIRVSKNLRVCSDCHSATKFISKVTGRVIIARDANRFHHFKGGTCSCGDYW